MDNFNLIPVDLRWGKKRRVMVRIVIIFFAVFAISFFALNILLTIPRAKILALQKETGQLRAGVESYNKLKEETTEAEMLLQSYENILSGNAKMGRMLEELYTALPMETWLNEVVITDGENAVLIGCTYSLEGLENFTRRLSQQKYFRTCQLKNIQEKEHNSQPCLMFTITCELFQ